MAIHTYSANRSISAERIERCARIYGSNQDAAEALDISAGSFSRLCRKHNIDTPRMRRKKRNQRELEELQKKQKEKMYCPYCGHRDGDRTQCPDCEHHLHA